MIKRILRNEQVTTLVQTDLSISKLQKGYCEIGGAVHALAHNQRELETLRGTLHNSRKRDSGRAV
jgi:hypothetical protein